MDVEPTDTSPEDIAALSLPDLSHLSDREMFERFQQAGTLHAFTCGTDHSDFGGFPLAPLEENGVLYGVCECGWKSRISRCGCP